MKILDIITENAAAGLPEEAIIANWLKANPKLEIVEKIDPRVSAHAEGWIAKNRRLNAEVVERLSLKYGAGFTFLKAIGIIAPLVLCIMNLRALNSLAQDKDSAGNFVHDVEWIKRQENAIVGVFLASQMVRAIASSVASGIFVSALRSMLSAVAMRTPGGGKATIIALVATQVAMGALQTWMNTPDGIEWCTSGLVMPLVVGGIGALGNIGLELLRDKVKKSTGVDIGVVTPDVNKRKDDAKPADTGPTSDQIAKWQNDSFADTSVTKPLR